MSEAMSEAMPEPKVLVYPAPSTFHPKAQKRAGQRVVFTGMPGTGKSKRIEEVANYLKELTGLPVAVFHIGQMMYAEEQIVRKGKILNLPSRHLRALRRSVFKEVLSFAREMELQKQDVHILVDTHSRFRWKQGLGENALELDQLRQFGPDLFINIEENLHVIAARVGRDFAHSGVELGLKDLLVWREEEAATAKDVAHEVCGPSAFFRMVWGGEGQYVGSVAKLILDPKGLKVYPSFPMTKVYKLPDTLKRIRAFVATISEKYVAFDPAAVDEWGELIVNARKCRDDGAESFEVDVDGVPHTFSTAEVLSIEDDLQAQIIARDYALIDQADAIVSLYPEVAPKDVSISSGVEKEIMHAYQGGKEVFLVWPSTSYSSPFVGGFGNLVCPDEQKVITELQKLDKRLTEAP